MNRRKTGTEQEERAAEFLEKQGMQILARNYRIRSGEIDLVAWDGAYLVFVEVKYRASAVCGSPFEAVDLRKQKKIVATARHFLFRYGYPEDTPCRFDVVGITGKTMEHLKDAFWSEGL